MKILKLHNGDKAAVKTAIKKLNSGGTLIFPTPTCYGLGASILKSRAVRNIYCIKKRDTGKPLSIIVNNVKLFRKYGKYYDLISKIIKKYPSELFTFVVNSNKRPPYFLESKPDYAGIMIARDGVHSALVKGLGHPIVGTSANISGKKECYNIQEVIEQFGRRKIKPDLVLDGGDLPKNKPSVIIKILDNDNFEVLRYGNIKKISV